MRFTYQVEVEVDRVEGRFASRDEIESEIRDALEGADPGSISGVGRYGASEYEVVNWDVSEAETKKGGTA